jgi:hypothetical protein
MVRCLHTKNLPDILGGHYIFTNMIEHILDTATTNYPTFSSIETLSRLAHITLCQERKFPFSS